MIFDFYQAAYYTYAGCEQDDFACYLGYVLPTEEYRMLFAKYWNTTRYDTNSIINLFKSKYGVYGCESDGYWNLQDQASITF